MDELEVVAFAAFSIEKKRNNIAAGIILNDFAIEFAPYLNFVISEMVKEKVTAHHRGRKIYSV